ncbi:MAG: sulfite exporter TauE/SafE family protein [bacterium]|nr:sulfite exporter TauE/SafE family protein [bacterium]
MKNKKNYYVEGMHCRSCEILIEEKILQIKNVKNVKAFSSENKVIIEYENSYPSIFELNNLFKKEGYKFFDDVRNTNNNLSIDWNFLIGVLILIFGIWFTLNKLNLFSSFSLNSNSSLIMFFILGLVAGFSTCGSLVGSLVLSLSKKWNNYYSQNIWEPYIMFNLGRILSYGFLGGLLGFLGQKISLSLGFGVFFTILISIVMIILALDMLNIKLIYKFKIGFPKFLSKLTFKSLNLNNYYAPFLTGALTFFLPCGFTLTAQSFALISGSFIKGAMIMFLFSLGTLPSLVLISISSVKILNSASFWSNKFSKVIAVIILIFAFYNINSQLNVLGFLSFNDLFLKNINQENNNLPSIVDGKQIIKMNAYGFNYSPNYFIVRAGIPVRWEITNKGSSGCTNVIVARNLFNDQINLMSNQKVVKEFIPQIPGKYKFSCWMGMVSGIIEVVSN